MTYVLLAVAVVVLVIGLGVATGRIGAGMAAPARGPRSSGRVRTGGDDRDRENLR